MIDTIKLPSKGMLASSLLVASTASSQRTLDVRAQPKTLPDGKVPWENIKLINKIIVFKANLHFLNKFESFYGLKFRYANLRLFKMT